LKAGRSCRFATTWRRRNAARPALHHRTPPFVRPDIVLPKHKTAIFVHGCFWHRYTGCKNCTTPTNRRDWWLTKLNGNAARDLRNQGALRKIGWRVIVIWECEAEREKTAPMIQQRLSRDQVIPASIQFLRKGLKTRAAGI
jgi:DNA mismatch endonuclease Vsr